MNISKVKTAIKIGDFVLLPPGGKNKIGINYLPDISKEVLTDESARIYIFVQDGEIKKIGGSASLGGIKSTINLYVTAMTGSPGRPRYIVHLLIEEALKSGSKVELFMITSPKPYAIVKGLFETIKMKVASFKEMERLCESDYFSLEKRYPDWNFQENHEPYPSELERKFNLYHQSRLQRR